MAECPCRSYGTKAAQRQTTRRGRQKRADEAGRQATRTTNIYFFDHAKVAILSLKVAF